MAINAWAECPRCDPTRVELACSGETWTCPKCGYVAAEMHYISCFEIRDVHGEWIEFRDGRQVRRYVPCRVEREPFTDWPNGQGVYE